MKIIHHVEEGPVVAMDRWSLDIQRNDEIPSFHHDHGSEDVSAPSVVRLVCVCVCMRAFVPMHTCTYVNVLIRVHNCIYVHYV